MTKKPNIIVIMTDQQTAHLSKREGYPLDTTPFLDSLASRGTCFDRAYTTSPICAPARVSMLTGRFPSAHQVCVNHGVRNARYSMDLVDVVKAQGYKTAMIGKNHSHLQPDRMDHWYELTHNGGRGDNRSDEDKAFDQWLSELNHGVSPEPTPFSVDAQGPTRAVSNAVEWISEQNDHPFFMWLSFAEPHNPFQVPEPYFSMFPPESLPPVQAGKEALARKGFKWLFTRLLGEYAYRDYEQLLPRMRSNYFGMLRLIDDQVKRLIGHLEGRKLMDNTIIVFLADHGDFVGEYGLMRKGPEIPEILARIPMFFVGPDICADATGPQHAFVSMADVFPTLCEALGTSLPHGVQGRSLWPILTGQDYPRKEFENIYAEQGYGGLHYTEADIPDFAQCLIKGPLGFSFDELNTYSQSGALRMLRKGDWKLVVDMQGSGQLFNLSDDPMELYNLFGHETYGKIQSELLIELLAWCIRVQDPLALPEEGKYVMKKDSRNYME